MKKMIFIFTFFLIISVGGVFYWLNFDPARSWSVRGSSYCHKRYPICFNNDPGWTVRFPSRFQSVSYLLSLRKIIPGESGFAEILVFSPDSLINERIRIVNPSVFLRMTVHAVQREFFRFQELESPKNEFLNGREVARGKFLVVRHSTDKPIVALNYAFISSNKGCSVVYFSSPDQFDNYREDAMSVIQSFKFGKEVAGR